MNSIIKNIQTIYNDNKFIYLYIVFIIALTTCFFWYHNTLSSIRFSLYIGSVDLVVKTLILTYLTFFLIKMAINKHPSPLRALIQLVLSLLKKPLPIVSFFCLLIFINFSLSLYTSIKSTIGALYPFTLDLALHKLDILIHFDFPPWQLTHALFSSPYATALINVLYNLWFFIVWGTLLIFMLQQKEAREKYILSFVSCWILIGGGLALLLASSGPCYIHLVENNAAFYNELFQRLQDQSNFLNSKGWPELWALETQDKLWQAHLNNKLGLGSGISAMPSMHVSMSVLMALGVYSQNRTLGLLYWFYALVILIGSIHLGWHYAIDGYVSIVATILVWKGVSSIYQRLK